MEITLNDVAFESSANVDDLAVGMGIVGSIFFIFALIISVVCLISMWKLFSKADDSGWKSIVPILNIYTEFKLFWANCNPVLMTILMLIPLVNCVLALILLKKMCSAFGKGTGFFLLFLFFSPIMMPILAFGKSEYYGAQ